MTEIKQLKIFIKHIGFSLQIDLVSVDMQKDKQVARSNLIQIISDMGGIITNLEMRNVCHSLAFNFLLGLYHGTKLITRLRAM